VCVCVCVKQYRSCSSLKNAYINCAHVVGSHCSIWWSFL